MPPERSPLTLDDYVVAAPTRQRWFRRPSTLVGAAVCAVVAASVLVDLPTHTTTPADIAAQREVLQQIRGDLAGCAYAAQETFTILADLRSGALSSADRRETPSMLRDDQSACAFTSGSIYDLSNIEGTGSAAGKKINDIVAIATTWATSDALGAIEDIQSIYDAKATGSVSEDLATQQRRLASDRAAALDELHAADALLHTTLPDPGMPALPSPAHG